MVISMFLSNVVPSYKRVGEHQTVIPLRLRRNELAGENCRLSFVGCIKTHVSILNLQHNLVNSIDGKTGNPLVSKRRSFKRFKKNLVIGGAKFFFLYLTKFRQWCNTMKGVIKQWRLFLMKNGLIVEFKFEMNLVEII